MVTLYLFVNSSYLENRKNAVRLMLCLANKQHSFILARIGRCVVIFMVGNVCDIVCDQTQLFSGLIFVWIDG